MKTFSFNAFLFCIIASSFVNGKSESGSDGKLNPNDNKVVETAEILLTSGNANEPDKIVTVETSSSSTSNSALDQQSGKPENYGQDEETSEHAIRRCPDITCTPPPQDSNCETIGDQTLSSNLFSTVIGTMTYCCPFWVCIRADGSFFTHFGLSGAKMTPSLSASIFRSHANGGTQQQTSFAVSQPPSSQFKTSMFGISSSFGNQNPGNQGPGTFGLSNLFIDHQQQGPNPQHGQIQPNGQRYPNGNMIRSNIPIPFPIFQFPTQQQPQQHQQSNGFGALFPSWDMFRGRRNAVMNFGASQQMPQRPNPGNPVQFYRPVPQFQPYY